MWRKIPPLTKDDEAVLRLSKRMKLYADEDIEDDVVDFFRKQGVNIKSARELGHRGKPDSFHAALAFRAKRFLVTRNGKHYWDDRAVPMNRTHGIIIVDADPRDTDAYVITLLNIISFVPYADMNVGSKMKFSASDLVVKVIDHKGRLTTTHYRSDRTGDYEWVADEDQGE
jgi:predicted nuclease of predicted toxin-antitoxin system